MAIGHISIRVHTRSKGHSAAAGLAYRMGVDLVDSRTGVEHLYARRTKYGDIVGCGMAGAGAFGDVAALAVAIEVAEKRKNSSLMRDVQVALPWELNDKQCADLTAEFSALLAQRYRTHTAWSVHRPDKRGDARNKHSHIVVPTRELDNGGFGKKLRILDDHKTGRIEVAEIRQLWERTANAHLERAGHAARVDVSRREDGNPAPTLGAECTALEREAAAERGEGVENRSVADLILTGKAVTWRGKALRRHQLWVKQQARQEERGAAPADEQEVATIAVRTAEPRALAARSRVGFEAPTRIDLRPQRTSRRRGAVVPSVRIAARELQELVAAPSRPPARTRTVRAEPTEQKIGAVAVAEAAPQAPAALMSVGIGAPSRVRPAASGREARAEAVSTPARVDLGRRKASGRRALRVHAVQAHAVAEPMKIITAARRSEGTPGHAVRVHAIARPARVRLGRVSPSQSIPAAVEQARQKPVAAPRRPSARSRPVASSVPVRPVRVVAPAAPQEQDMTALEPPPPSLQELADRLYEEVYARQDAEAARRPADRQGGLGIGFANWPEVQRAVRHDGDLCRGVAARAASRAADAGQPAYAIHHSWADRIADWIREHVAAGLELLGLRRRQSARRARRKTAQNVTPEMATRPDRLEQERTKGWLWQQLTRSAAAKAREALPTTYEPYLPDKETAWRTNVLAVSDLSFRKGHRRLDAATERDRLGRSVAEYLMNNDRDNADLRAAAEQQNETIRDEIDTAAMSEKREIAGKKLTGWFKKKPSDDAIRVEANRTDLPPERYRELTRNAIEHHIDRVVKIIREVCDRTLQHDRDDWSGRDTPSARSAPERTERTRLERDRGHDRGGYR